MASIYLDHSASTPMHPEVIEAMLAYMRDHYGNASSVHSFGRAAKRALSEARDQIAQQLHCQSNELVFTGGGTESDNTALFGAASAMRGIKKHIITSSVEHHAVLHACNQLERMGYEVSFVSVDSTGQVDVNEIEAAIRPDTFLISIMYGNNEVGTVQPIEAIGELARARGILFHVDAVQALGMTRLDLAELPVDLMSFSSHKINGPQGVGALYVSRRANIDPLLFGGLQERKRRAGTENIAGIIGFAKAVQLVASNIAEHARHLAELRDAMLRSLHGLLGADRIVVNGHPTERLPHILNVSFPDVPTETMLMNLDMEGIAASSGSACTSGSLEVSHVLVAMKLPEPVLRSAVRFSFGLGNTMKDVEIAAQKIATIVDRVRKKN